MMGRTSWRPGADIRWLPFGRGSGPSGPKGIGCFILLWLLPILPLRASTSVDVIDLLPKAASRAQAEGRASRMMKVDVKLVEIDPKLLETLRWATDDLTVAMCSDTFERTRDELSEHEGIPVPAGPDDLLPSLLTLTGTQVDEMELDAALETLKAARATLPCRTAPVDKEQVRRLFLYEGFIHLMMKDGLHEDAFLDMLAVAPELIDDPNLPPKFRKAIVETAVQLHKRPYVSLDIQGLEGDVLLNGGKVDPDARVRTGRHVLQLQGPFGEIRTALVRFPAEENPVDLSKLLPFSFPPRELIHNALVEGLMSRSLDKFQEKGLKRYLSQQTYDTLLFAVGGRREVSLELLAYTRDTGLVPYDPETTKEYVAQGRLPGTINVEQPVARGPKTALQLRLGGDTVLGNGMWTRGAAFELGVHRHLATRLLAGAFMSVHEHRLESGEIFPSVEFGLLGTLQVPLTKRIYLQPAIGYSGGKGPPARIECAIVTSGSDGTQTLSCPSSGSGNEAPLLVAPRVHGPTARIDLVFFPDAQSAGWRAGLGIQTSYSLFASVKDGETDDGSTVEGVPFTFDDGTGVSPLRLEVLASLTIAF